LVFARILTETRAGAWNFDVASVSGVELLAQRKLASPYVSPESKAYISEFKVPEGHWKAVYNNY
jgi:ABC-type Fe3+ transport system substrate-binding protein